MEHATSILHNIYVETDDVLQEEEEAGPIDEAVEDLDISTDRGMSGKCI